MTKRSLGRHESKIACGVLDEVLRQKKDIREELRKSEKM
jgi:hypothetical protein